METAEAAQMPAEPSRWSALVFLVKARCHQAERMVRDWQCPVPKHPIGTALRDAPLLADWSSDLWRGGESPRERLLQLGKVQNLRVAAQALDGLEIPAGQSWSFWRHLGRTTVGKGYSTGRELREGCLVPQTGGGLCQLSGAIYNAALEAGLEIVERHAHSNSSVGSLARIGRDATVFWNYVDLRLRHVAAWRLEVELTRDQLHVRIRSLEKKAVGPIATEAPAPSAPPNACATCGLASCYRSSPLGNVVKVDRVAALVDGRWPEWDAFFAREEGAPVRDLYLPMDGHRFRKPNYAWALAAHGGSRTFSWLALRRSWATRKLRNEGARRQRTLLEWDARLADAYGRKLQAVHSHLIVTQSLLPHLWRNGWLGGRSYDVLMTRFPLAELHRRLDDAAALHPESRTCADFRAEPWLVEAETHALEAARQWITPHRAIASLAAGKARLIDWTLPEGRGHEAPVQDCKRLLFPASTLCRKGAFELREALRDLPVELALTGGVLEGADFWAGIPLVAPEGKHGLDNIAAVVLPAFVEHNPRPLLRAIAAGIPVIASDACGVTGLPGVTTVTAGDPAQLRAEILKVLASSPCGQRTGATQAQTLSTPA